MHYVEWTSDACERIARVSHMMGNDQAQKQRRLLKQAVKAWRKNEADEAIIDLERPPERVH